MTSTLARTLLTQASAFAVFALASHTACAASGFESPEADAEGFSHSQTVSDKDLSEMRGGFSVGGMNINFTFTQATSINNQIVQNLSFNSADLDKALASAHNIHVNVPPVNISHVTSTSNNQNTPQVNVQVAVPTVTLPTPPVSNTQTITVQNTPPANNSVNLPPVIPTVNVTLPTINPTINVQNVTPPITDIPVTSNTQNVTTTNLPVTSNVQDNVADIQSIPTTTIIQNTDNGVTIAQNTVLDIAVHNAGSITHTATSSAISQLSSFNNVLAFH